MWSEIPYSPVLAAVCVIAFTIVYALWRQFRNVAGRETESQHEINVDTRIPATLIKHAKARKRNIHEVPRDDNCLFSALADQLTDATFTGQSLRDHIETFISDRWSSEQHESFLLSNPNSRHDTRPTIQDASDFLRHNIVLYRDDDNPPFLIQPSVDGPDPIFQVLHIGCINNKYYVSFRPHGYNQEFKKADVPYIPHTKTHDQMTTIQRPVEKRRDRRVVRPEKKHINVRIPEDKEICVSSGCCHLNDGNLMVTDSNNRKLKRVDPSSSMVTKFGDTDEHPTDVCCIGPQEVAVAFLFNSTKVQVYSTESLTRTRTIELGHDTYIIACHGGLLYCAEWGVKVLYVHDVRSGRKLREISVDTNGRKLFSFIKRIAVNSSGDRLYVADNRGLVCVGTDGRQIFCLSEEDLGLTNAFGVTTDHHGHVFVCGYHSHNVVKVTEDGHVVGQILSMEDGIPWRPACLSYDVSRSSLYVVGEYSDQLLVAEWK